MAGGRGATQTEEVLLLLQKRRNDCCLTLVVAAVVFIRCSVHVLVLLSAVFVVTGVAVCHCLAPWVCHCAAGSMLRAMGHRFVTGVNQPWLYCVWVGLRRARPPSPPSLFSVNMQQHRRRTAVAPPSHHTTQRL